MNGERRKTGERQRVRQPLKIDKLPVELRDRIQKERGAGRTWEEIEFMSAGFPEWGRCTPEQLGLFLDKRLPAVTLARWWDLRVDQVRAEATARMQRARELAASLAGPGLAGLPDAVRNALGDQIFALMQSAEKEDQAEFRKDLLNFGFLLAQYRKLDIQEQKVTAETKRVELLEREFEIRKRKFDEETDRAARKLGKGKQLTIEDISRIRERTFGLPPIQRGATTSHPA